MGKYDPLATFLRRQRRDEVSLTFREIERIVSGILPKASADPAWWIGDEGETPAPHKRAWTSAAFTPQVDFKDECVRFVRSPIAAASIASAGA
jgi:hypothetical protein